MAADSAARPARTAAREPLDLGAAELAETADGVSAAVHYGDFEGEHRLLGEGCGLLDRPWLEHLELTGEDRKRFLNGMVTGDTRKLAPGAGLFTFFTSAQGRILAEARVLALEERLLLELPAGCAAPIAEHLSRYVVADRVEVTPRPELRALSLLGPDAPAVAARLLGAAAPPAEPWGALEVAWRGSELVVAREERLGSPAVTLHLGEDIALRVAEELRREGDGVTARPAGFAAAEARRVEAGMARFGPDFGDERFPQEVGETGALDFEKGCYLGQEVVARIHYRGKVNHRLCGLRLGGGELPTPGTAVELDGDPVGRSGTAVRSPALGEGIALAVLHRRAETGAVVAVAAAVATVAELPFGGA